MSARRESQFLLGFLIVWAGLGLVGAVNAQQIFADDFESGDTSAWFKIRKPGGLDVRFRGFPHPDGRASRLVIASARV